MMDLTDATFDAETNTGAVVVDFWAPWCAPCRQLSPLIEKLADANPGIKFVKVNVDENPGVAAKFNITNLPAVIALNDGAPTDEARGNITRARLNQMIGAL